MSYIKALDVSRWQGNIDWSAVKSDGYEIAVIKISGGDDGLYYDSKANQNYNGVKAVGMAVGGYHFAGGTDANAEAEYFVKGMQPFEENDVFVLDWEVQHDNPVGWCQTFVNKVHELSGVWCIVYMNGSTLNSQDWSPVTANCGIWVAWYGQDPNADLPVRYPYIMHQYTSTGSVAGISGNVDLDAWYYDIATWNKYGWHAPTAPEPPKPVEPTPEPPKPVKPPVEPPIVTPVIPQPIIIHTSADVHVNQKSPIAVPAPITGGVSQTITPPKKKFWLVRVINSFLYFFDIKVKKS